MIGTKAVLIIGGSGFVGSHLALRLREEYKVFSTYNTRHVSMPGVTFVPMNVTNRNWMKRVIYMARPDVIIYVAGSEDIVKSEADPRSADATHTNGLATVLNLAEIFQPKFFYLSSSYAFDGQKGNYRETDVILPSTAYGKAKIGGENVLRSRSLNYIVIRSSPLFGRSTGWKLTFFDKLRMALDRGERIKLPSSELHSFAPVEGLLELMARLLSGGPRNKLLHYGGLTKLTHYQFGRAFATRFGYDPNLIMETETQEQTTLDYSLNSTQIVESLQVKPLLLEESFDLIEKKLVPGL